ncbi:hypothetical protein [Actinoplanes philippinensis]|uniref:hypothetical protein n=1 Tax=Actinoplanes philippinensis TaxID=35752 RepID=UPI0033C67E35
MTGGAPFEELTAQVRDALQLTGDAGEVHVRDNRLGRLAIGAAMAGFVTELPNKPRAVAAVYERFHLSGNVIDGAVSETLARHTAVTANDFTLDGFPRDQSPPDDTVAHVIGDTAVYTGNHARRRADRTVVLRDVTRAGAEAANLELRIV